MSLVPHKIVALNENNEGAKNTIAGAVVSLFDSTGAAVTLFDDESGSNGSTTKQTDSEGVVVVYVTPGEYSEQVNGGVQRKVLIGSKEITTDQLIGRVRKSQDGDVLTTTGFTSAGDGGGAQWKATNTTGLTPSQTPADRGAAELVDGSGRLWVLVGSALFIEQLGAVLDGVTLNSGVVSAAVNWSNSTGGRIYLGIGTLLCSGVALVSLKASIRGINRDLSVIKIADGTNNNVISMTGSSELDIKNVTLDGNRLNQAGGHGIRGGGCNKMHVDSVTIKDCYSYGIGFQAGTNKNVKINNLIIHGTGQDGIDIKDYNSNNETIFISNFHAYNYGLLTDQQVGLDIRGPVVATNIVLEPSKGTNNYGFRARPSSVQGRAGSGSITNLKVIGDGASTDHIALDIASNSGDINISNVNIKDFFLAMRLEGATTGGNIEAVSASGIYGTDCMSISGSGWLINALKVENTSASSRVFDVEVGAQNIRITNVNLTDNSANASSARIQAGASNIQVDGGFVTGGAIADSGTDSVINVTYL